MNLLEMAQQIGLNPKWVASTAGGEYHSPCPNCGGKDRFFIQPQRQMSSCLGYYCCRQCGISGSAAWFSKTFLGTFPQTNSILPSTYNPMPFTSHKAAILRNPPALWIKQATNYVDQSHQQLLHAKHTLEYLAKRGLSLNAIQRYKIGWNNDDLFFNRTDWGLNNRQNENGNLSSLWIPQGIVIPTIYNDQVIRIKIRRSNYQEDDRYPKYIAISGSMNGLSIIGDYRHKFIIVVESELDAYALHASICDFALVIAIGSNIKNPDNITDRLARNAKQLLICHDNDGAGKKMLSKWQRLYKQAKPYPTPVGKDVGEAIEQGLDIRGWIQSVGN